MDRAARPIRPPKGLRTPGMTTLLKIGIVERLVSQLGVVTLLLLSFRWVGVVFYYETCHLLWGHNPQRHWPY
jgi:hypothetical protein